MFNFLVHLNHFLDKSPTNNPNLSTLKWTRQGNGIPSEKGESLEFALAPGESKTLFNGSRSLSQTSSTQYQLLLKTGTTNTYQMLWVGGPAPVFRTLRTTGADATTQATVTKSANVITIASTGGTAFNFIVGGVVVGDFVSVGNDFSQVNQGRFQLIQATATSISFINPNGTAEGPITMGADFADQVRVYSSGPVQVGDTLNITATFSPATYGAYEITGVQDNLIEFYSNESLVQETVTGNGIAIYSAAKKLIYLETDKKVGININGSPESALEPFYDQNVDVPGMMLKKTLVYSLVVTNSSVDAATMYYAGIE